MDTAQRFGSGRSIVFGWSIYQGGTLACFGLTCVLTAFETQLWDFDWYAWIGKDLARALLWIPVVAFAANARIFWRLLVLETPDETRLVGWVRVAGTVLAALPLAGTFVLPLWRTHCTRRPQWAFRSQPDVEPLLCRQVQPVGRTTQRAHYARVALLSSFWLGFIAFTALGMGLGSLGKLRPSLPMIAGFTALHLAGLAIELIASPGSGRRIAPWLWLIPAPGHILAFRWSRFPSDSLRTTGGLVTSAHDERTTQRRSQRRRTLSGFLYGSDLSIFGKKFWRRLTESLPSSPANRVVEKERALVRWKMFLLFFDGFLLLHTTRAVAGVMPALLLYLSSLGAFLVSTLVAIVLWLAPVTQSALGLESHRQELWQRSACVLWLSQLAFISGQQVAYSLARARNIVFFWQAVAIVCTLASVLILIVGLYSRRGRVLWFWFVLYLLIGTFCLEPIPNSASLRKLAEDILVTLSYLAPLGHLLLVLAFGNWLLWPVSWRNAFDPRLPDNIRRRTRLAALALTLPFGGLLAPLWSFVRPRLVQATTRTWWLSGARSTSVKGAAANLVQSQGVR